jgi:hypothetical protein
MASLLVVAPAHAQDEAGTDEAAFEATVAAERDAAQARSDDVIRAIQEGCEALSSEACNLQFVASQLPLLAQEAAGFADLLDSLDAPEGYAEDVATHVAGLRELASIRSEIAVAAEANDEPRAAQLGAQEAAVLAGLASELSPEYARFAFLSMFGADDYVGSYGDSTAEELEYFDGLRLAGGAAVPQFDCFNQALSVTYGDTTTLLGALYDCGAGTALPAIESETRLLTPPARFVDAHEWLLAERSEASRLDLLIGEAARDGDVLAFLGNNVRLGLLYRPYAGLDAAFYSAAIGAPLANLDPTDELARSDYGRGLFAALRDYEKSDPLFSGLGADFPQVPRAVVLEALTELGPELRALEQDLRSAVEGLDPPAALADDHALIVGFLEARRDRVEELLGAAAAGADDVLFSIGAAADADYCAIAETLSDTIEPISSVYFDADAFACR